MLFDCYVHRIYTDITVRYLLPQFKYVGLHRYNTIHPSGACPWLKNETVSEWVEFNAPPQGRNHWGVRGSGPPPKKKNWTDPPTFHMTFFWGVGRRSLMSVYSVTVLNGRWRRRHWLVYQKLAVCFGNNSALKTVINAGVSEVILKVWFSITLFWPK